MSTGEVGVLRLTALFTWEDDTFVALCPELDIATHGDSLEEAKDMLRDALEGFFEVAKPEEIERRLNSQPFVLPLHISGVSSATLQCRTSRTEAPLAVAVG